MSSLQRITKATASCLLASRKIAKDKRKLLSNYIKKEEDVKKVYNIQNRSIEFSLMISLPAMIGLFLLAEPIIKILLIIVPPNGSYII